MLTLLRDGLGELGYQATLAIAPTPLAALWLARAGQGEVIEHKAQLAKALGQVPLNCLRLSDRQSRSLNGMGLQNVADLVRLPRDGLSRRLGKELVLKDKKRGIAEKRLSPESEDKKRQSIPISDTLP